MEHRPAEQLPPVPTASGQPNADPLLRAQEAKLHFAGENPAMIAVEHGMSAPGTLPPTAPPPHQGAAHAAAAPAARGVGHMAVVQHLPTTADDTDLIEKEWVLKAKEIVAIARQDPFVQSREIGRVKADYIKKRFNKDVKLGD